ncbi:MAG: GAF domain-containing protein [Thermodesulfovibrionales bacterium]
MLDDHLRLGHRPVEEELRNALEDAEKRKVEITALLNGANAVLRYPDFKSSARAIYDICKNLIGATSGYISLISKDKSQNEVVFLDSGGLPCNVDPDLPMPIRGLRGEVYKSLKTLYENNFAKSKWMDLMPDGHAKLSNVLFAPMILDGKVVGLLGIANKPGGFNENDARLASAFAELAAISLTKKYAEDALHRAYEELKVKFEERNEQNLFINRLLELFIKKQTRKEYITSVVKEIEEWGGFECVGIRIMDRDGYIPYEASTGFSADFLRLENMLSIKRDMCACIRVITGEFEPQDKSVITQHGSFIINDSFKFIKELKEEEQKRFRGNCIRNGYLSIAIIPIRYQEKTIGAIHLADRRKDIVPLKLVNFLETVVTPLIGEAIQKFMVEEALRKSKENLLRAQHIAHLGNWIWDIKKDKLTWSEEVYQIFGLPTGQELTFETFLNYVHPEDKDPVKKAVTNALYGRQYDIEHRIILSDGKMKFVHEQGEVIFGESGEPVEMLGTVQDITERKMAEIELMDSREQLRNLLLHLQTVREEERMKIAREIHDELGQALTALKLDISMLSDKLYPDHKNLVDKTESMIKRIDETIQSVKKICTELRPPILDHFGITAAIEWYVDEFKKRTGINCDVSFEPNEINLNQELSTALFRICQEALTNVSRHADASEVKLELKLKGERVLLEIKDNGKGITEKQLLKPKSYGIMGIKERVNFLGGNVTINGIKGEGTYMSVSIPIKGKGS